MRFTRRRTEPQGLPEDTPTLRIGPFSYHDAVALLAARGLDWPTVGLGSMGPAGLGFIQATISSHFPKESPVQTLHIGNYVGVSLAALSATTLELDPRSRTVSIDPNMPHLGVNDPQAHVFALLAELGLQDANVVICGYTFERNPTIGFDGRDLTVEWQSGSACENVLPSLRELGVRFDVALLDGSHVGSYARREVEVLAELIRPNGLLFLDNVEQGFEEIEELFRDAADGALPFERLGYREPVGVLLRRS